VFKVILKNRYQSRIINNKLRKPKQSQKEIKWSAVTSFIFTLSFVGIVWLFQHGKTAIYTDISDFDWWYLPVSLLGAMLIHEAYYYFLHRWMHHPKVFKYFHYVHHDSIVTSPWTAFSFHPIESILQALIVPLIVSFIPMHMSVIFFLLILMTVTATINHLHIEVYPKGFSKHWFGKWWIGSSHHSLHHSKYHFNYGLYFTFMDSLFKTESSDYLSLFEDKTKK
jgi:sterol desaturase/sphingolipid hydroxylase (fatty acid hydroxylase superfamily)